MKKTHHLIAIQSLLLTVFFLLTVVETVAQTVTVGKGSYSLSLPAGAVGPSTSDGQPVFPKISSSFDKTIQTNDFWSSLIFPFTKNPHSNNIFAHPLNLRATGDGLELGYTSSPQISDTEFIYPFSNHVLVSVRGLTTNETLTEDYGDWTSTAVWDNGSASMKATFGHGLPFVFFTINGGNALVSTSQAVNVWFNENEVLGITVDGKHYGIFAPSGASWSTQSPFESSLNNQDFFSVAVLPDATTETLEFFRKHAYAFVTESSVDWEYDESTAEVNTTFTYETELKDPSTGNINETLTALYRHQWMYTVKSLTNYTYQSPRGLMKLSAGNSFTTTMRFNGILPTLPDIGEYNRIQLLNFVQDVAEETLSNAPTYQSGKEMGRFSRLVHIADQLGAVAERDYFLSELKTRLEEWLTVGGPQEYSYNDTWKVLTGYPSGFGADREINDHHFHSSYAILSAATIAQYDKEWAAQENWGGMINLLIRDANNWNRNDADFPFLRSFDAYAGHSWAAGHADFTNGNNQESSSESMNFATATFLWGDLTNQPEIRDLGIYLHTTEASAIDQYWFDVDNETFPSDYSKTALGIVWGNKGAHTTWFGTAPEFIHGINFLPITSGSFYLGKHPEYILENYTAMVNELGSQPTIWKDVLWMYLALADADLALSYYQADPNYSTFDGESRAHTMHWLYNIKKLGHFNTDVYADTPGYSVFVNASNDTTYIAFNSAETERIVHFSDGFSMTVPPLSLYTYSTADTNNSLAPAPNPTAPPENVISVFSDSYAGIPGTDFTVDEGQTTFTTIESIQGNNTLKYANLDFQTTAFGVPQNISSRTTLHLDYWTEDASNLAVSLSSKDNATQQEELDVVTSAWQSLEIPLSNFSEVVDLQNVSEIKFTGNGTVYVDNIYFSGSDRIPDGPRIAAEHPNDNPENVLSIFSDSYTNLSGTNFDPDWSQETVVTFETIDQNTFLKYENLNYQGTHFGSSVDVSTMEWFHLNYWTDNSSNLQIYLINPGPVETFVDLPVVKDSWQSVTIPLSEYTDEITLSNVFQIKIVGDGTLYLDNLYFAKSAELTNAPTPTHDAEKVVSLFSDAYDNVPVDTWSAGWDQANVEDLVLNGNTMKHYTDLTFAGVEFTSQTIDGSDLTHLRFDAWIADETAPPATFGIKLVDFGANGVWSGGDDVEHELRFDSTSTPSLQSNTWIQFDIPLTDFTNMVTDEHLAQILFLGSSEVREVYIDNVYFYNGTTTQSDETSNPELPSEIELKQNYPNPFNPSTNIAFSIPEVTNVSLTVYNALGQKISELLNTRLAAGSHSIYWDASTSPTGVYFYQLKTGDNVQTKKMLLIK